MTGRQLQRPARPRLDLRITQVDERQERVAVRDRRRQLRLALRRAQFPRVTQPRRGLADVVAGDVELAEHALAPGRRRAGRDLVGEPARPRRVARQQHQVGGAQQPVLALLARRAEPAGGDQRGRGVRTLAHAAGERIQPRRERVVGPGGGRGQVSQRRGVVVDHVRRGSVQRGPPRRPELCVDRRRDRRWRELDRRHAAPVVGHGEPSRDGDFERGQRVGAGERRGVGEQAAAAEHRRGFHQRRRLAARHPIRYVGRELARCRQHVLVVDPRLGRHLAQERQRQPQVTARMRPQPPRGGFGQRRQRTQLDGGQRSQLDPAARQSPQRRQPDVRPRSHDHRRVRRPSQRVDQALRATARPPTAHRR